MFVVISEQFAVKKLLRMGKHAIEYCKIHESMIHTKIRFRRGFFSLMNE